MFRLLNRQQTSKQLPHSGRGSVTKVTRVRLTPFALVKNAEKSVKVSNRGLKSAKTHLNYIRLESGWKTRVAKMRVREECNFTL